MQLSLSYTMSDLDDILPPGSYKLDLVDRAGMPVGVTVDVEIGSLRNASAAESQDLEDGPVALTSGASDMRFILEANVRSTQLAFQHNQRTLEAGLRIADTLREGIQTLAETQADWIKSLVASRGFLRNGAMPQLAALAAPAHSDDDADDETTDDLPASGTDRAMELGLSVVTLINNFMSRFPSGGSPAKQGGAKFDVKSLFDWRHASKIGEEARASLGPAETAPHFKTPAEAMAALPPDLVRKLFEVRGQLTADEQSQLMQLLAAIPPDELPAVAAQLGPMSADDVLAMVRKHLAPVKGD